MKTIKNYELIEMVEVNVEILPWSKMVFYHQKYYSLYLETYTQSQVILVSNAYYAQSAVGKLGTRLDSVFGKKRLRISK